MQVLSPWCALLLLLSFSTLSSLGGHGEDGLIFRVRTWSVRSSWMSFHLLQPAVPDVEGGWVSNIKSSSIPEKWVLISSMASDGGIPIRRYIAGMAVYVGRYCIHQRFCVVIFWEAKLHPCPTPELLAHQCGAELALGGCIRSKNLRSTVVSGL